MTRRERWQRWLKKWRSRQGPWTLWDLDKRDRLLYRCSTALYNSGFTANKITLLGFLLNLVWIASYEYFKFKDPILHLALFIIPIGISDLLDGSTARNNDDVTLKGTLGDHFRDLLYIVYAGRLALDYGFALHIFAGVLLVEFVVLLLKVFACVWYVTWRIRKNSERFWEFCLDNFQHSSEDRWQSILLYFGFPTYIVGAYYALLSMTYIGRGLVVLSLGVGFMVFVKELRWTATPHDEEEKE